jgi:cystathionine beta-lyase family protein involved in aluminum resistance
MGYQLSELLIKAVDRAKQYWPRIEEIRLNNQARVLKAFRRNQINEYHLSGTTGYGYNDPAREKLAAVFSDSLQAEAALVQPQLISGTHAINICLKGMLRPGDHFISASGPPYDTLQWIINGPVPNSLTNSGVEYTVIPLTSDGHVDLPKVTEAITDKTKMVMLQRSPGYSLRRSISVSEIGMISEVLHKNHPGIYVFVDNCYGEFVEEKEPTFVGADLMAGSLIKNPGGTIAPTGGYIAGRKELVQQIGDTLTAPGLGNKVGPLLGLGRTLFQGLFMAPHIVGEALMGTLVTAALFEDLGYQTFPSVQTPRSDIVQAVVLNDWDTVVKICRIVQNASPIDSNAQPEPGDLPGYADPVIMAAGTFVQGSSLELSADAPMRPPYALFLQGGICKEHVIIVLNEIIQALIQS